jgi:tetratricopeptide (TPR) repeat protein
LTHLSDPTKSRGQYLPLLQRAVLEDRCARTLYYLGREYWYAGQWRQAIYTLAEYLECPDATWDAERCAAMRHAAACHCRLGQPDQAVHWLIRACLEAPMLREPFVELAQLYHDLDRPAQAYAAVLDALRITVKATHFLVSNHCWGPWPHELAADCAQRLGLKNEAAQHLRKVRELQPDDELLPSSARLIAA